MQIDTRHFLQQIEAAAARIAGVAHRTPVLQSATLDRISGVSVLLKCENLQRTGAFKFRGAYNTLKKRSEAGHTGGVITHSSGNHAQALACAGQMLGIAVTVVMPDNAPQVKRLATEGYGAEIIKYDPQTQTREEISARLADERDLHLVPPYDHPDVIAGQGTAAAELLGQAEALDLIVVPTGGGGLLSGTALASLDYPGCRVVGVEPEVADDATRSFRTGKLQQVRNPPTIADGVRTPSLGRWTFPIVQQCVHDMVTVTEQAIVDAVVLLLQRTKLLVEPSGALGVAALLSGKLPPARRVGIVLSGGNVDALTLARLLDRDPP